MSTGFSVKQKSIYCAELERITGRQSWDVTSLAAKVGWTGLPNHDPVVITLSQVLSMLILSDAMRHHLEADAIVKFIPNLRNEALIKLGSELTHWYVEANSSGEREFFQLFYADDETVRQRVSRLLGCSLTQTTRELLFYSQSDVVCVSNNELHSARRTEYPRFFVDSHDLAARVLDACGPKLFTAIAWAS